MAIKALNLKGEIITTPFSWIATCSAIKWENCTPVFVDIDPKTLNIAPNLIGKAITKKTVAIMPVHVFSNPCDIEAIEKIAKKYDLKVIYDAAHAFGVKYNGKSIMEYGDVSCTSFHATKIFNTGEGGACFSKDPELFDRLRRLRFFGHNEKKDIIDDGCNGKMTEIHAALGLANLPYLSDVISRRKELFNLYFEGLKDIDDVNFQRFDPSLYNYSYMPIIFKNEKILLKVETELKKNHILPRRYFYPSINTYTNILEYQKCPISEDISKRILCLPLYWELNYDNINKIIKIILQYIS